MLEYRILSSLEKVFPDGRGVDAPAPELVMLKGENLSFQLALKYVAGENEPRFKPAFVKTESDLQVKITARVVKNVPVQHPRPADTADENYLSLEPGMYPDVLSSLENSPAVLFQNEWQSIWLEIEGAEEMAAGEYPIVIRLADHLGEEYLKVEVKVTVLNAVLPKQTIAHTEWFHSDCLADYYQVPAFSEKHWEIVENFVRTAVKRGCNMLLTPHFTQALDTYIGGERTTVQLVDVTVEKGEYSFEFSKLKRWIEMALDCGMEWIEMAHLFTQWGATAAPKVMATVDGEYKRIFGWDTPSVGGEYTRFLRVYLTQLVEKLKEWGVEKRCYFHISDEPNAQQLAGYKAAKESIADLIEGFPIMDAMSHYEIYEQSGITPPVVSERHLDIFLEHKVSPLWDYYCCGPTQVMTNRFIVMPLARTRALGLQLWKYNLQGFLHWGYNFYNTVWSLAHINPYQDTESAGAFPPGDAFLVYPGPGGKPEESIRIIAMHEAMQDARALQLLEKLIGREKALAVLEAEGEVTLEKYPWDSESMLRTRARINAAIAEAIA